MGEENVDRGVYVDTGTSGEMQEEREGRDGGREEDGCGGGWKSANENENQHTEVIGKDTQIHGKPEFAFTYVCF